MNVIFLDIDGVLNDLNYFMERHPKVLELYTNKIYDNSDTLKLQRLMLDIDIKKLKILKEIIDETKSLVVITSSWKTLEVFPYVKNELIKLGIPIIDVTKDHNFDRGTGIKNYLKEHNVENYIILDDDIFKDYDEELLSHLIKTSFISKGLSNNHKEKAIKKLIKINY